MSAIDEYRLLNLTLTTREIVKDLDCPEDIKCMLLWLEERGYGTVDVHVEDAMRMVLWHNGTKLWVPVKTRCEWLLRYVARLVPELPWPAGGADYMTSESAQVFQSMRWTTLSSTPDALSHPLMVAASNIDNAWKYLLEVPIEREVKTVGSFSSPTAATRSQQNAFMARALGALEKLHEQSYALFTPNFFRDYALTGCNEIVIAGTQNPEYSPEVSLRWRL